jgi:hypothetical protein
VNSLLVPFRRLLRPALRRLQRAGLAPASQIRALHQIGWIESVRRNEPVDAEGEPLPWFAYGAISLLDQIVPTSSSVLEIGGGNSSLWWASRGNGVTVFEANADWAESLRSRGMSDVTVLSDADMVLDHVESLLSKGRRFDVVVVDGVEPRTTYLLTASRLVSEDGVLVVDNSDRVAYRAALEQVEGFSRLDFFGMGPHNRYAWATSVFSRSGFFPRGRPDGFHAAIDY